MHLKGKTVREDQRNRLHTKIEKRIETMAHLISAEKTNIWNARGGFSEDRPHKIKIRHRGEAGGAWEPSVKSRAVASIKRGGEPNWQRANMEGGLLSGSSEQSEKEARAVAATT